MEEVAASVRTTPLMEAAHPAERVVVEEGELVELELPSPFLSLSEAP